MIVVFSVLAVLIGYPAYSFIEASINGGAKKSGNVWQVDLKALGNFAFDENNGTINDVPKKWRDLDGKRVQLQGFQYAGNYAGDEIPDFQFVYNIQKCCFGGPPKVQERVFAHSDKGVPNYAPQFATLTGTLHVRPKIVDGKVVSLYDLDIDSIALAQ